MYAPQVNTFHHFFFTTATTNFPHRPIPQQCFRIRMFISTRGFYFLMALDFLTILAITLPISIGAIVASKIAINRPKSADKYRSKLDRSRELYIEELEDDLKTAKNTMNSRERGPMVEGKMGDLENLLPELVGSFDSFAPKWLKPFLRNKEIQSVLIDKVKQDPEKYAGYFTKLIGKKKNDSPEQNKADTL